MKEWFSPCNKHLVQWKTLISHSNVALNANPFKCCFKCNLVESIYSSWVLRIPKHTDMLQKDWVLIEIFENNEKRYHSRNWYKYLWFLKLKTPAIFMCLGCFGILTISRIQSRPVSGFKFRSIFDWDIKVFYCNRC